MSQSSPSAGDFRSSGKSQRRSRPAGPEPYDFRRPAKLAREHVRTLQIAYESFARQFSTLLTSSLRTISHVSLISIGQQSYDEYISSLSSTTVMALCTIDPLPGITILEFSVGTAMICIDHLLGGTGGPQPQRPPTDIETPLLKGLINRTLGEFQHAMEAIVEISPQLVGIEYNPQFAQVGVPSDIVIVAAFDMRVADEECVATLCLPLKSISSKLQNDRNDLALPDSERQAREDARRHVLSGIRNTFVDVSVCFQPVMMRPADLVSLRPGDVIPLVHPTSLPLAVVSSGRTFAYAMPGNRGNRLACLVVASPPGHKAGTRIKAAPMIPARASSLATATPMAAPSPSGITGSATTRETPTTSTRGVRQ